jgi:hypothetical protein
MKKFLSLVMLLSIGMALEAGCDRCACSGKPKPRPTRDEIQMQIDSADEAKSSCCECQKPCNTCSSCGCKTEVTAEEVQAGVDRCACSGKPKPRPTRDEIQTQIDAADEAKSSCCECQKPCNTCSSCGCKTEVTDEEVQAGVDRCACSGKPKPRPTRDEIQTQIDAADEAKSSCCECQKPCNTCNSCGCKTEVTDEEVQAGTERCACSGKPKPRP